MLNMVLLVEAGDFDVRKKDLAKWCQVAQEWIASNRGEAISSFSVVPVRKVPSGLYWHDPKNGALNEYPYDDDAQDAMVDDLLDRAVDAANAAIKA